MKINTGIFKTLGTVAGLLTIFLLAIAAEAAPGDADQTFQARIEQSGTVLDTAVQPDGKIIVVGKFGKFDERIRGNIARVNSDGSLDESFNPGVGTDQYIRKVLLQPDGKILIGGIFGFYSGGVRKGIARLNADGSLDTSFVPMQLSFDPEVDAGGQTVFTGIYAIALQTDGKIVVGGLFSSVSTNHRIIVRLNPDGSRDETFAVAQDPATLGVIFDIAVQTDGKIIVVGFFGTFFSVAKQNLVRLNPDGTIDHTYANGGGTDHAIYRVRLLPDGKAIVGGQYNYFYTQYPSPDSNTFVHRRGLARLNTDGSVDTTFNAGEFPPVIPFQMELLAGGKILAADGKKIIRFNSNGAVEGPAHHSYLNGGFSTFQMLPGGKLLVGGSFTRVAETGGASGINYRNGLARIGADGLNDDSFDPGTGAVLTELTKKLNVKAIEKLPDGKMYIGGRFNLVNGFGRPNLARLNADGTLDESFNPTSEFEEDNSERGVTSITVQPNGCLVVGSTFLGYGTAAGRFIHRFCGGGEVDPDFIDLLQSVILPNVLKALPDGKILAAGFGLGGGGMEIIRLNAEGGIDNSFAAVDASEGIYAMTVQPDGKILIGGEFTQINGNLRQHIARLNSNGTLDFTFLAGTSTDGRVYSIVVQPDGKILLGGAFTHVRGFLRHGIARIGPEGEFDASFAIGTGFNFDTVRSIALQPDGKILAGGNFTTYNTEPANKIVRINPDGSRDATFRTGFGVPTLINPHTLVLQGEKLLVGADSTPYWGRNKPPLMRIKTTPNRTAFDFDGDGRADVSVFRPSEGNWYLNNSSSGFSAVNWGVASDALAPADYDGDGKTDYAVFRPVTSPQDAPDFYILQSSDFTLKGYAWGIVGDVPTPADFDGDGKAEIAVWRPGANAQFYIRNTDASVSIIDFGRTGDVPQIGDWDGDGKADPAVYRAGAAGGQSTFYYRGSLSNPSGGIAYVPFGLGGDRPVAADFDADGRMDAAVYRAGVWHVGRSADGNYQTFDWGLNTDTPVPADYDGDGRADPAVYRQGVWYVMQSLSGQARITRFGLPSDAPIPAAYLR